MPKDTVYSMVTDRMVAALEAGTVPWQKPWTGGHKPASLDSGKPYRGINIILLGLAAVEGGYMSRWWLTYRQAEELGGHVRKGEHGTVIVFWQMVKDKRDPEKTVPMLRYYRVFNLEQCEDVRVPKGREDEQPSLLVFDPVDAAEAILANYPNGPKVVEGEAAAWYRPDTDLVNLPPRETFVGVDEFYATAFHELTHSTGAKSRLDRFTGDQYFGSHDYGREELVAEMGAAFLSAEAGIESTFDNSAAYLNSWLRVLKEDPRAVVVAAGAAQKATDLILDRKPEEAGK